MKNIKVQNILCHFLDLHYARIAELMHLLTIAADQMIVLAVAVCFLELRLRLPKAMLAHQVALQQQVHGVVERSPAHPVVLALHAGVQAFDVEVPFVIVHLGKYGEPLGRFAMAVLLQVFAEDALHIVLRLSRSHLRGESISQWAVDSGQFAVAQ